MSALTLREALLRGKRRPRRSAGGSPTSYRGDGYEFVELRTYIEGDDVRRIDWAASARAGELQSRVVLEDVALTLAVLIDDSASMRVGRGRMLLDAALEARDAWIAAALRGDRVLRVGSDTIAHPLAPVDEPFDLSRALATARAGLRRGTALLAVGDWYDLDDGHDDLLANLGAWCDCTALIARDPWYDELPLGGVVRLAGAEGGRARVYVGRRERAAFARAVREREQELTTRFDRAGWRTGTLLESDGAASLRAAFGAVA